MNCPKCGSELHVHYTRQANYFCDCGYNFKEHQYTQIVFDWQARAEKAEAELERVKGITEGLYNLACNVSEGRHTSQTIEWIKAFADLREKYLTLIRGEGK